MAHDEAYYQAEKKIEEALKSGADYLDINNYETSRKLTEVPEILGELRYIRSLTLGHNSLSEVPECIRKVTSLESLDLSNNRLTHIPNWIGELVNLKNLYLGNNQLSSLPESLEKIYALRYLGLWGNKFTEYPAVLETYKHLGSVDLSDNLLTDLPVSLAGPLDKFFDLKISNNPLNPDLSEAHKQGRGEIRTYLLAKANGEIILNQAKLILVGEGEVGKTCLVDALLDKPWQEHLSTHGIGIQEVKVNTGLFWSRTSSNRVGYGKGGIGNKIITLNAWDFGGQRVYRPTHQLFFSAPAVYLVVWKPREGSQAGQVKEWIQLVKRREPSAKILVVATHGGPQQRQPDIDRQELWDLFGKDSVVDFFFVDSKPDAQGQRKGIDELKRAIAQVAASLPEVGRSVPKRVGTAVTHPL